MEHKRSRIHYLIMIAIVICLGLLSRRMTGYIPDIIDLFLGDSLWALMIYLLVRVLFIGWAIKKSAFASAAFCFFIEVSQLYHSSWIDSIRRTTLGGLVLGYGFLWSDLAAYLLGIGFGILIDLINRRKENAG